MEGKKKNQVIGCQVTGWGVEEGGAVNRKAFFMWVFILVNSFVSQGLFCFCESLGLDIHLQNTDSLKEKMNFVLESSSIRKL